MRIFLVKDGTVSGDPGKPDAKIPISELDLPDDELQCSVKHCWWVNSRPQVAQVFGNSESIDKTSADLEAANLDSVLRMDSSILVTEGTITPQLVISDDHGVTENVLLQVLKLNLDARVTMQSYITFTSHTLYFSEHRVNLCTPPDTLREFRLAEDTSQFTKKPWVTLWKFAVMHPTQVRVSIFLSIDETPKMLSNIASMPFDLWIKNMSGYKHLSHEVVIKAVSNVCKTELEALPRVENAHMEYTMDYHFLVIEEFVGFSSGARIEEGRIARELQTAVGLLELSFQYKIPGIWEQMVNFLAKTDIRPLQPNVALALFMFVIRTDLPQDYCTEMTILAGKVVDAIASKKESLLESNFYDLNDTNAHFRSEWLRHSLTGLRNSEPPTACEKY